MKIFVTNSNFLATLVNQNSYLVTLYIYIQEQFKIINGVFLFIIAQLYNNNYGNKTI